MSIAALTHTAATHWNLRPGVTYLNHGSFGPSPASVLAAKHAWQRALDEEPMDFFTRQLEPAYAQTCEALGQMLETNPSNLVLVDNATAGMNVIADSFPLEENQQVILPTHEYGAVERIWKRRCQEKKALLVPARLPAQIESIEQVIDAIFAVATRQTKLLVVSHITSATAITLPIAEIAAEAKRRGIAVAVDGPHALVQVDVHPEKLGVDYYTASCHKWMCAPLGSGCLWVAPQWHATIRVPQLSWGRLLPEDRLTWRDEFLWGGTRDYGSWLGIAAAIEFWKQIGVETFREHARRLAHYTREKLAPLVEGTPITPAGEPWNLSMVHLPIRFGDRRVLQAKLFEVGQIEVPIVEFEGRRFIRVSHHLYNNASQIDHLAAVLKKLLDEGF